NLPAEARGAVSLVTQPVSLANSSGRREPLHDWFRGSLGHFAGDALYRSASASTALASARAFFASSTPSPRPSGARVTVLPPCRPDRIATVVTLGWVGPRLCAITFAATNWLNFRFGLAVRAAFH